VIAPELTIWFAVPTVVAVTFTSAVNSV